MTIHRVLLDYTRSVAPLRRCPGCGRADLIAVVDGERTAFWCPDCRNCWQRELGQLVEVDPYGCVECANRERCREGAEAAAQASTDAVDD